MRKRTWDRQVYRARMLKQKEMVTQTEGFYNRALSPFWSQSLENLPALRRSSRWGPRESGLGHCCLHHRRPGDHGGELPICSDAIGEAIQ